MMVDVFLVRFVTEAGIPDLLAGAAVLPFIPFSPYQMSDKLVGGK
jgi:hypothetical protein